MSIFSFLESVGDKISNTISSPSAKDLKKELDAYDMGTSDVQISLEGKKAVLSGRVKDQATYEKTILAIGNADGVNSVDASRLAVDSPQVSSSTLKDAVSPLSSPTFYTVKAGDTLSKIAASEYGKDHAGEYTRIFDANKPLLTSPDKIYPGQVLRIPRLDARA